MPTAKKGLKFETWLSIANLVTSILVGIGVTLYINYRNEQLQLQIVKLQSEIQRESSLAKLEIEQTCPIFVGCNGAIRIKNNGLATAHNIKAVIITSRVSEPWKSVITKIEDFNLMKFPQSIAIETQNTRVDTPYQTGEGNNAFQITIESLPPNAAITLVLSLSPDTSTQVVDFEKTVIFYEPSPHVSDPNGVIFDPVNTGLFFSQYLDSIDKYLIDAFWVSSFGTNATCDNCEGIALLDRFIVSAIEPSYFYEAKTVEKVSTGDLGWTIHFEGKYRKPADLKTLTLPIADYLEIKFEQGSEKPAIIPTTAK
jgi:hypothetical protein